jgi:hypothetical protein
VLVLLLQPVVRGLGQLDVLRHAERLGPVAGRAHVLRVP